MQTRINSKATQLQFDRDKLRRSHLDDQKTVNRFPIKKNLGPPGQERMAEHLHSIVGLVLR